MSLHDSADIHIKRLKQWVRAIDQINQSGEKQPGLNESYVLFALNEGKNNLQRAVANNRPSAFASFVTKQISALAKEFPIPEESILGNRIIRLDYAASDDESSFLRIHPSHLRDFEYGLGNPGKYAITSGKVLVWPIAASGYYRFCIQRRDETLDRRRAAISDAEDAIAEDTGNLVSLVLATELIDAPNASALALAEWICVCDYSGVVKLYNVPILSYDATAEAGPTLTVRGDFEYETDTIAAGDFITIGKNSSTHSQLPLDFQDYYVEWAKYRLQNWDASDQAIADIPVIKTLRDEIVDGFSATADEEEPPIEGDFLALW